MITTQADRVEILTHRDSDTTSLLRCLRHTIGYVTHGTIIIYDGIKHIRIPCGNCYTLPEGNYLAEYHSNDNHPCKEIVVRLDAYIHKELAQEIKANHNAISLPQFTHSHIGCTTEPASPHLATFFNLLNHYLSYGTLTICHSLEILLIKVLVELIISNPRSALARSLFQVSVTHKHDVAQQIRRGIIDKTTIAEIAERCNMSVSALTSHCIRTLGSTPHNWIMDQRLGFAHSLLSSTQEQIKTIAKECGFASSSHLIRLYKQKYGITPNRQRQLLLNAQEAATEATHESAYAQPSHLPDK